ncbi:flagellar hook-length control protein FliK [Bacillus timonensis]|uniref:flagellar hook-length control protein FliK n=1 Tax=Bacillus timonensis TaxID=1033734 RepID=UPI0002893DF3|nr:flagellar hook-length control protein FliK [Bacillus timonensis]
MNVVANFEPLMGSIRKSVASGTSGNGLFQGENVSQLSFRESLFVLTSNQEIPAMILNEKIPTNMIEEKAQEDPSIDTITHFLSEMETFTEEKMDLSDFQDALLMFPPELVDQIKAFISSIQSGTTKLELDKVNGKEELIGLLLLTTSYVEDSSFTNKEGLLNLLKQLKMTANEMLPTNFLTTKDASVSKVNKFVQELIQKLENKFLVIDKHLIEPQSRNQYLQTVHARYFSTPKGIETPQPVSSNNQFSSSTIQEAAASIRTLLQVGKEGQPESVGIVEKPEKLLSKASSTTEVTGTTNVANSSGDASSGQLSKVQQFSIFVDQNGKQVPNQQQFIRQFQNILARSSFLNGSGQQKLLINLYPEHLGSLRIELLQSEGGMIARIMASTSQAKDLVESQLSNLKHSLQAQNISIEKIEVSTQLPSQTEKSLQRESEQQQGHHSGKQQKDQDKQETNEDQTFTAALHDELVNFKV